VNAIQPYLFFDGRCAEAVEFYKDALDAKVEMLMRFKDSPEPLRPGTPPENVMHAALRIGDAQVLASDGETRGGKPDFHGFAISLTANDDAQAKRFFGALAQGGKVTQPLIETFFASSFGMVGDRFGVQWIVMAQKEAPHG
jgi:PhnB protein